MPDAVPSAPRSRNSALSELLHRWPSGSVTAGDSAAAGQGDAATPATAPIPALSPRLGARSAAALSLAMPIAGLVNPVAGAPSGDFAQAATRPSSSPADPSELDRALVPANDLSFTRTLERVLLAELRRQGLASDSP
jgi:hypothetical protein